jgi:hypothetical protein
MKLQCSWQSGIDINGLSKYDSLSKEFLAQSEADEMSPEAREVVSIRSEAAKSSVKKFAALVESAS